MFVKLCLSFPCSHSAPRHTSFSLCLFCNTYHTEKKTIMHACLFLITMNSRCFLGLIFYYAIRDAPCVVDERCAAGKWMNGWCTFLLHLWLLQKTRDLLKITRWPPFFFYLKVKVSSKSSHPSVVCSLLVNRCLLPVLTRKQLTKVLPNTQDSGIRQVLSHRWRERKKGYRNSGWTRVGC